MSVRGSVHMAIPLILVVGSLADDCVVSARHRGVVCVRGHFTVARVFVEQLHQSLVGVRV